jgi:hypothetical protein
LRDETAIGEENDTDGATGRRASWVTITTVCPNAWTAVRVISSISVAEWESRLPVGSSAKINSGR